MPIMTDSELLDLLEGEKQPRLRPFWSDEPDPPEDNPSRYSGDNTFDPLPASAPAMQQTHFYYFGVTAANTLRTLVYCKENTPHLPMGDLVRWIGDAKAGGASAAHSDLSKVEWCRPGFLVFLVDIPGWSYLEKNVTGQLKNRALYFAEVAERDPKPKYHANYCFYGAETIPLQIGASSYNLLAVQNCHFKPYDPSSGSPKHQPRTKGDTSCDDYKFDIFLGMPIENGGGGKKQWIVFDPGGKNLGP